MKLEKFLDPRGVRADLLDEFRRTPPEPPPNYAFEDDTLFHSTRPPVEWIRRLLRPVLKLFLNPNPLIQALHLQAELNTRHAEFEARRHALYYELIHNLVVEVTRLGIEVKNVKMRVESLDARVDFNERRARALESAVMYRPAPEERDEPLPPARATPPGGVTSGQTRPDERGGQASPGGPGGPGATAESPGQRSRRRRRRRGRRGGAPATSIMGAQQTPNAATPASEGPPSAPDSSLGGEAPGPVPARGTTSSGQGGADDEQ